MRCLKIRGRGRGDDPHSIQEGVARPVLSKLKPHGSRYDRGDYSTVVVMIWPLPASLTSGFFRRVSARAGASFQFTAISKPSSPVYPHLVTRQPFTTPIYHICDRGEEA